MITGTITKTQKEGTRFRIFAKLSDGSELTRLFEPDASLEDIRNFVKGEIEIRQQAEQKAKEAESLIGVEITL